MKDKGITMVQWTDFNQNNSFVKPLLCGISGAAHLALVDLTAGWLADKIQNPGKFSKNFKFTTDRNVEFI